MSRLPVSLHSRLRALDVDRAERQTRLIAALNARTVEGLTLIARAAFARDRRGAATWIRFRAGDASVHIAPLLVDGGLARLSPASGGADPAVAAALLGRMEPVVAALEAAAGSDLYPERLEAGDPDDEAILLRIDAYSGGAIRHRLLAALPATGEVGPPVLPAIVPAALGALRRRWSATLSGPSLRAGRIAKIGSGDLMLLGIRPGGVQLRLPGRARVVSGRIDLIRGTMTLQDEPVEDAAGPAPITSTQPDHASEAIAWDTLRVPTVIEIDGAMISASEAAMLGGGSVIALPAAGGTLPVRVVAGGALLGTGELVAVGEGFGVLFTEMHAAAGPAPAAER